MRTYLLVIGILIWAVDAQRYNGPTAADDESVPILIGTQIPSNDTSPFTPDPATYGLGTQPDMQATDIILEPQPEITSSINTPDISEEDDGSEGDGSFEQSDTTELTNISPNSDTTEPETEAALGAQTYTTRRPSAAAAMPIALSALVMGIVASWLTI